MWRWSYIRYRAKWWKLVISTYVEMIPHYISPIYKTVGDLHVCGDDPKQIDKLNLAVLWSPRMWRWSLSKIGSKLSKAVISTYVEMILSNRLRNFWQASDLHVCGDDPNSCNYWKPEHAVISTYVEMIPTPAVPFAIFLGDLHVCGDDPKYCLHHQSNYSWSPRMWRWSQLFSVKNLIWLVISTYVEMIPTVLRETVPSSCDLHVCGDDPLQSLCKSCHEKWSPRMWRWSLSYL